MVLPTDPPRRNWQHGMRGLDIIVGLIFLPLLGGGLVGTFAGTRWGLVTVALLALLSVVLFLRLGLLSALRDARRDRAAAPPHMRRNRGGDFDAGGE